MCSFKYLASIYYVTGAMLGLVMFATTSVVIQFLSGLVMFAVFMLRTVVEGLSEPAMRR